jgi:hypothetical protein
MPTINHDDESGILWFVNLPSALLGHNLQRLQCRQMIKQTIFRRPSSVALLLPRERRGSSRNYRIKASKNRTFAPRNLSRDRTNQDIMADLFSLGLLAVFIVMERAITPTAAPKCRFIRLESRRA